MREAGKLNVLGRVWSFFWASKKDNPLISADDGVRPTAKPKLERMGLTTIGSCDEPWLKGKRMIIRDNLDLERTLDVFIHEHLHAGGYAVLAEEWVGAMGTDLARNILLHFDVARKE